MSAPIEFIAREANVGAISAKADLHPLLRRVFSSRGIDSADQITYSLQHLIKPESITNLSDAADILADSVSNGESILIFGDYDADGATSTALCMRALGMMHHSNCAYLLPDRQRDGYGVSEAIARRIVQRRPDLVITVDTGIASFTGLEILAQAGIAVIVTDHHLPADQLPSARCIVNPNAFADHSAVCLAGVGVAFYLMLALRAELKQRGWFDHRDLPNLGDCLDLVALGTVADLVPLDYNNRILVHQGLQRIRAGNCSMGIKQLLTQAHAVRHSISSQDLAFTLAPRINAAGRLDDMTVGVRTLLAQDGAAAAALANELDAINRYRRELQGEMTEQAEAMLNQLQDESVPQRHAQVLFREDWHEGIIGIIASRIKDLTFRPAICFAVSDNDELKGSCRSIPGIHIRDMLDLVDKRAPGIILRFGGHAMAAGLTIRRQRLDEFVSVFEDTIKNHNDADVFANRVYHDGELERDWLTLDTARMLLEAGPWGQRFPLPSFIGEFQVKEQRILADRHLKLLLAHESDQQPVEALRFFASPQELEMNHERITIHFELAVNEFRDQQNLQLIIRHLIGN